MRLAYGTYAIPTMTLEQVVKPLADIGYAGIEVCVSDRHAGASLQEMTPERCAVCRQLLADHGLSIPAVFLLGQIYTPDAAVHMKTLEQVRRCGELARDLGASEPPVVAIGFGGRSADWEGIRGRLAEQLADYSALAEEEGIVIAGEAHCHAAVDRSERVVWLLEEVAHPRIRLHFDIVHFWLAGENITETVQRLLLYTAHTHVTDARRNNDGSFELTLLGEGQLNLAEYVAAMHRGGWRDLITVEVSTMVWSKPDYDPIEAAKHNFAALARAFAEAEVDG
ncbi:MAG: sugar phosphate isomerase/epimerase [Armatimonadetes bacterium]|nr:sugar phosphate isomerase/epimerase [Armatimonadota bacterium]